MIAISVIYALPDSVTEVALEVPAGSSVGEALERSLIAARHPGLDIARCPVGIRGRRVDRNHTVASGDRIEIYRPLVADPKQARRRRARAGAGRRDT